MDSRWIASLGERHPRRSSGERFDQAALRVRYFSSRIHRLNAYEAKAAEDATWVMQMIRGLPRASRTLLARATCTR
jgi:hypothetical protein